MTQLTYILILAFTAMFTNCSSKTDNSVTSKIEQKQDKDLSKYTKTVFASGCFWCVEAIF